MAATLPPGPRAPRWVQTARWWTRPVPFFERCRARYGRRFTIRLLASPPFVMLTDPEQVKQVFTAPAEVLHPGSGARILEPLVGRNSVILLDEDAHLAQRRLMLPAFHGEQVARLAEVMAEVAAAEVERWPRDEPVALHPRLQALTLEVILRTVFGLEAGGRLDRLREHMTEVLAVGTSPVSLLPPLQHDLGPRYAVGALRAHARGGRRGALRAHRGAPPRRGPARRRPLAAPRRAPRRRLADERPGAARRAHDAARRRARDDRLPARVHLRAPRAHAGRARAADGGGRGRRRRRVRHGDGAGEPAAPAGAAQRGSAAGHGGDRGRRLALSRRGLPGPQRVPRPARPGDLPRPLRLPARALPRQAPGHVHVDPVRRRAPALPRRGLRHGGDEGRAARRPRARPAAPGGRRAPRALAQAQHHAEPARGRRGILA